MQKKSLDILKAYNSQKERMNIINQIDEECLLQTKDFVAKLFIDKQFNLLAQGW